ncbi:MAG TPA: 16S rRNA (cytosine(1402)-N(4))-methyltransferase RsmH [Burkholderiales bacterium]|nr:16S rRNA (cytosine(1402)-N(4))-methyltransferase RsmH [Burkholderiales bacterium]
MSVSLRHETVLLEQAVAALKVKPDGTYVDATFGRGGHSRRILEQLGERGRLLGFDKDPAAIAAGADWNDRRFELVHSGFEHVAAELAEREIMQVDGVLMDLGVSSPQLDDAQRGFSFRFDAPLDMRMDSTCGQTAAEWLAKVDEDELKKVISQYGEERYARAIARAIVAQRIIAPIATTKQLAQLVASVVPFREFGQNPATRTFQAIRIYLNRELEELSLALPRCAQLLASGGRLVVISFHSLEDRIVKRFMREQSNPPPLPRHLPIRASDIPQPKMKRIGGAVYPDASEIALNPRARSAVMRVLEAD